MTKFTIVFAVLVALANIQPNVADSYWEEEEDPVKDALLMTILNAKNLAYDKMQKVKMLSSSKHNNFIEQVQIVVEKVWLDIETLKQKSGHVNTDTCDKVKDEINNNALKTISHYQSCIDKVVGNIEWEMQSMSFDSSILTKDIHAAKVVDEDLHRRTAEIDARSHKFDQYIQKLEKCDTQSNLPRLKRQNSEALTSYTQCLKKL